MYLLGTRGHTKARAVDFSGTAQCACNPPVSAAHEGCRAQTLLSTSEILFK